MVIGPTVAPKIEIIQGSDGNWNLSANFKNGLLMASVLTELARNLVNQEIEKKSVIEIPKAQVVLQ